MSGCVHVWVSNSGQGGKPVFKPAFMQMTVMHVMCKKCGDRTWYSKETWEALKGIRQAIEDDQCSAKP